MASNAPDGPRSSWSRRRPTTLCSYLAPRSASGWSTLQTALKSTISTGPLGFGPLHRHPPATVQFVAAHECRSLASSGRQLRTAGCLTPGWPRRWRSRSPGTVGLGPRLLEAASERGVPPEFRHQPGQRHRHYSRYGACGDERQAQCECKLWRTQDQPHRRRRQCREDQSDE